MRTCAKFSGFPAEEDMRRFVQMLALTCSIFFAEARFAQASFVVLVGDATSSESLSEDFRTELASLLMSSFEGSHPVKIWNPGSLGFGVIFNSNFGSDPPLPNTSTGIGLFYATSSSALGFQGDGLDGLLRLTLSIGR